MLLASEPRVLLGELFVGIVQRLLGIRGTLISFELFSFFPFPYTKRSNIVEAHCIPVVSVFFFNSTLGGVHPHLTGCCLFQRKVLPDLAMYSSWLCRNSIT